jgi:periplasmic protein TonB
MFNNLLESQAQKQSRAGGTLLSLVLHTAIITAGVMATVEAKTQIDKAKAEEVEFVQVKKQDEPPPPDPVKAPPPPDVVAGPPPPKGFQVLAAPVKIPDAIPEIDLSRAVTRAEDFSARGVAGGTARGVEGGVPQPVNSDQPYFEFQVERQVRPGENNQAPRYPDMLRSANVEGQVVATFVVDTTGRADMSSFKVLSSTHELFTAAVRSSLPSMRFYPAEVAGRKVKQLVSMPFVFSLSKGE